MKTMAKNAFGIALVGLLVAALPGIARAQKATIKSYEFEKLTDEELKPKPDKPQRYPHLKLKVGTGAAGLKANDFQLKTDGPGGDPVAITGEKVVPFKDSEEQLDILILVQGSVRFMGDPAPEPVPGEEAGEIKGYFEEVKQAIDEIARARTKKTNVALYIYADKAEPKVPLGPAANVTGDSLGVQADYRKHTTKAFKISLSVAATVLSNAPGRRVLFVIGDGEDQSDNASINDEIKKLEDASIEVYVLGANPRGPLDPKAANRLTRLGKLGDFQTAAQGEQIPQLATTLANAMNNVYTVEFPGALSDGTKLPFDGEEHDVSVVAKKDETEPRPIKFMLIKEVAPPPVETTSYTWLWVLLGVVALAAVGAVAFILMRKPPEEEEVEEEPPPPVFAPPPPPAPSAPPKTMMIGIGGGEDAMPMVGWVVPLSGSNQFQTFKLSSKTTIGTVPDCGVVVQDPFMSTKHAEIIVSGGGYTLMDSGSTNGVMVMGKRVQSHELVDNDVFTLGKTDFKFKSIN
jgi:hypothetical protein